MLSSELNLKSVHVFKINRRGLQTLDYFIKKLGLRGRLSIPAFFQECRASLWKRHRVLLSRLSPGILSGNKE